MKQYVKEIDGKRVIKTRNRIVIRKDGKQIFNPTEEMALEDGWVEYVPPTTPEPSAEELIERAKRRKLDELYAYDESSEVNDCIIVYQGQELHYWANKTERDSLKGALRDCMALGRTEYRLDLRELGVSLGVSCEKLLQMLVVLEVYAIDCYNRTTDHEFAIKSFASIEEVDEYDFHVGYPEVLTLDLNGEPNEEETPLETPQE